MLEEQNQPFEMRCVQLAVDAVKRVGHGVGDLARLEVALESENVVADNHDIGVLSLGDPPDQEMNLARILREIRRNLLTNERIRQIRDLETALDRVVVGDRDVIHPALDQLPMQLRGSE